MNRQAPAAAAAALSFCALAPIVSAQSYRIVELPTLGANSVARDINDAGVIVGSSRAVGSVLDRPVKWEGGVGGMGGQISDLDPQRWFSSGTANAIDNLGRIAMGVAGPLSCFPAGAMLLNPEEPWNPSAFPADVGTTAMPAAILGDSQLLGCVKTTSTSATTAALWSNPWGSASPIFGSSVVSEAAGTNSWGAVVGWRVGSAATSLYASATFDRAFIKIGGQITDLPTTGNRALSQASAISETGLVVGSVFTNRALCVPQIRLNALPVTWTNNVASLLAMPGLSNMGAALDANTRGEIIGQVSGDGTQYGPVVWRGGTAIALRTHLRPGHEFIRLDTINAINAAGQVVGSGTVRTATGAIRSSAFVATPCYADFNGNGVVNVADIFDYLSAFFAGSGRADVSGASGVTTNDLFDFIGMWFAGCS